MPRSLAEMQIQEEYDKWCMAEADEVISRQFQGERITERLKVISTQLRAIPGTSEMLDKMSPQTRRAEMMRILRKEVLKELSLPPLEEWRASSPQGDLF